jgi:alcohol dehydrogenase
MRAVVIHAHGGLDQLKIEDWPDPEPGPGEALIEVKACGLNYLDIFVRRGMPGLPVEMPRIPGGDISGIVRGVGEGVPEDWVGTRVLLDPLIHVGNQLGALGEHANGGLCELICIHEDNLIPLPGDVWRAGTGARRQRRRGHRLRADRQGRGRHRDRLRQHPGQARQARRPGRRSPGQLRR